ncbi:MAG: SDR family oxidoreductase [Bradymonadales bacterium]|nr:SDR family oxidoreductase [Bradymonadales bacterium]
MNKPLAGHRALVTGASSGIGAELARDLARRGADLVVVARRKDRLKTLAEEITQQHGVDVRVEVADLNRPDSAQILFDRTEGQGLAVDILINNAGLGVYEDFLDIPWEQHANVLQVNAVTLTHLTHLFVKPMVQRGRGWVMNIGSIGAYSPTPSFAVYTATKTYVRNFTEALDHELKGTGVRAMVLSPGGTYTEFSQKANQQLKSDRSFTMMSAERCARIGINKMLKGRRTVIAGWINAVGMWLLRLMPRYWMPWLAAMSMSTTVRKGPGRALPAPTDQKSE